MSVLVASRPNAPRLGIAFIISGMLFISVNDMLIKQLSGDYPLHQMVFIRSAIGLCASMVFLHLEGGFSLLKTRRPGLHLVRALLVVFANMTFFAALAVMPLANATALFFVAPLFITLLSIPVLGEKVGLRRIAAVSVGFLGVLVMLRPGVGWDGEAPSRWALLLPVVAAAAYAGMQVLTRKLGAASRASALAIYIQVTFLLVSLGFFLIAGDGRYAEGVSNGSLIFLLRAWVWPAPDDLWLFGVLGLMSGGIGYTLSQAYRLGDAATIAPFEYVALPLAIFWGWMIWGELPDIWVAAGIMLIAGSGIYVYLRERYRKVPVREKGPVQR
jgi:S-adenosylmethionine uptake transporter